ncbi:hypothetical protein [Pseudomonas sp. CGJS7]|uniref:hypothetical protein n=1 Tax=Pseudomonas sp. CGJS7 TaxID=3109348 RepID=UPI003009D03B
MDVRDSQASAGCRVARNRTEPSPRRQPDYGLTSAAWNIRRVSGRPRWSSRWPSSLWNPARTSVCIHGLELAAFVAFGGWLSVSSDEPGAMVLMLGAVLLISALLAINPAGALCRRNTVAGRKPLFRALHVGSIALIAAAYAWFAIDLGNGRGVLTLMAVWLAAAAWAWLKRALDRASAESRR